VREAIVGFCRLSPLQQRLIGDAGGQPPFLDRWIHNAVINPQRFKVALRAANFRFFLRILKIVEFRRAFRFAHELELDLAVLEANDAPVRVVVADDAREIQFELRREFEERGQPRYV